MTATWHVEPDQLEAYLDDDVDHVDAASIEAHLMMCCQCRATLADHVPASELDESWAHLERRIDDRISDPVVRAGHRLGLPEVDLRLVAPTNSLRVASLLGSIAALATAAALAGHQAGHAASMGRLAFLIVAPLVPLAAVVGALGTGSEPAPELARCAPISRIRIAALRTSAALGWAIGAGVVVAELAGGPWTRAQLWLLPALALASLGAIATRFLSGRVVLVALGSVWIACVTVASRVDGNPLALFGATSQLVYFFTALAAVGTIAIRPALLDPRELP